MAFVASYNSRLLYGPLALSGYARDVQVQSTVDMLDVTTLANTAKAMIPGQDTSTLTCNMLLDVDAAAGTQWTLLGALKGAGPAAFTLGPSGLDVGDECWMVQAIDTSFSGSATAAGTVDLAIGAQTDGPTDMGVVIEDGVTAITADGNGTARDGTAASSNGGVAHIHVTAFSGLANNIVTIEHSVDGSTSWATLATFATYTGLTSERVVVAAGTTVRRYLRVVDNVTGTGSTNRVVTFARR
jgi:hypothetical protein